MKYTLDTSENSIYGEASRVAMQGYAYRIERVDRKMFEAILEDIHKERRRILGEFSSKKKK